MKRNGQMKITEQIKQLVDKDEIDVGAAMVLMLTSQAEILERLSEQEDRLQNLEQHNRHYPSLPWMWKEDKRSVIVMLIALALLYTFIFNPWLISDIRHAVLEMVGLPQDLGITTP